MQAIVIKYAGPTNSRGSRWIATCAAGKITVPYDYALDTQGNAKAAVQALCQKLGWTGRTFHLGQLHCGQWVAVMDSTFTPNGYCFTV